MFYSYSRHIGVTVSGSNVPKPVHPLVSDMLKGSIKSQISQLVPAVSNIVIK